MDEGEERRERIYFGCSHPSTPHLPAGDGGLGSEVSQGGRSGKLGSPGSESGGQGGNMRWGSQGLGVSSRHKRSRVSSPAHSAVVTSASRASCVPLEQHGLRLLENFVNSARNTGSNRE